jgi:DNA-binding transcriptional ArsR family regulator
MSRTDVATLDTAFTALADPTRRAVIRALLHRPRRAGELAQHVDMSPPALSRHLRVLRKAGLIVERSVEEDARVRVYSVERRAFAPVRGWLAEVEELWHSQLESFKQHAERGHSQRKSST